MSIKKVMVLGGTGMLGQAVCKRLVADGFAVTVTARSKKSLEEIKCQKAGYKLLDASVISEEALTDLISGQDYIINCIGVIKTYIKDDDPISVENAIRINSSFPYLLSRAAEKTNSMIIQIATDCVFSGEKGNYTEKDYHDALDVYGKTKSLGEVLSSNVLNIRCSIIGPENKSYVSLLEWFRRQPKAAKVYGFLNHYWNGISTFHFAKICSGIIRNDIKISGKAHLVPKNKISKARLLRCFSEVYNRLDITINDINTTPSVNRTIDTKMPEINLGLWTDAGYIEPPTIEEIVREMAIEEERLS